MKKTEKSCVRDLSDRFEDKFLTEKVTNIDFDFKEMLVKNFYQKFEEEYGFDLSHAIDLRIIFNAAQINVNDMLLTKYRFLYVKNLTIYSFNGKFHAYIETYGLKHKEVEDEKER
jgi:hypothetical protein